MRTCVFGSWLVFFLSGRNTRETSRLCQNWSTETTTPLRFPTLMPKKEKFSDFFRTFTPRPPVGVFVGKRVNSSINLGAHSLRLRLPPPPRAMRRRREFSLFSSSFSPLALRCEERENGRRRKGRRKGRINKIKEEGGGEGGKWLMDQKINKIWEGDVGVRPMHLEILKLSTNVGRLALAREFQFVRRSSVPFGFFFYFLSNGVCTLYCTCADARPSRGRRK